MLKEETTEIKKEIKYKIINERSVLKATKKRYEASMVFFLILM